MELSKELQLLMHHHGSEQFNMALLNAYLNASDHTEDLENKAITQKYSYYAHVINGGMQEEPEFNKNKIED